MPARVAGACPAWRGGDFRSPRKPAGAMPGNRGQPVKARNRPPKEKEKRELSPWIAWAEHEILAKVNAADLLVFGQFAGAAGF